ncbi:hypothetical protein ACLOJK_004491 [Asimina triloba]
MTRQQITPNRELELIKEASGEPDSGRPAAGTAAEGATVAGRRRRDGTRPATGSHNPQAVHDFRWPAGAPVWCSIVFSQAGSHGCRRRASRQ